MFSLYNQIELRKITVSSLLTCIYLPIIVTGVSFKGLLYTVGKASSMYILCLIFAAEICKSIYLYSSNDEQIKRPRSGKVNAKDVLKSVVFLFAVALSFFVGIILFGAPVLEGHEETLMLSSLLTLLSTLPLVAYCGVESAVQYVFGVKGYSKDSIVEMLIKNAALTVCGAWLGAVVIPLDWNTPWQQWPIPCYLGALGGYLLSNVLTVLKVTLMSASQKYPTLSILVNVLNSLNVSK